LESVEQKAQKNINSKRESFGLWSIDERIKLYFGEGYGLSISNAPIKGTVVEITIPFTGSKDVKN